MFWFIVNTLAFVGTPTGLIWGWIAWSRSRPDRTRARSVSLIATSAATLSLVILFAARFFPQPVTQSLDKIGFCVAAAAVLTSLLGYRRLIIPVWLISIGAVTLWYGLTLP